MVLFLIVWRFIIVTNYKFQKIVMPWKQCWSLNELIVLNLSLIGYVLKFPIFYFFFGCDDVFLLRKINTKKAWKIEIWSLRSKWAWEIPISTWTGPSISKHAPLFSTMKCRFLSVYYFAGKLLICSYIGKLDLGAGWVS